MILPYMGYVMCNEQVWSHFDLREFDLVTLSKSTSLNHTLYEEVMNKQREVLLVNSSFGTVGKVLERRRIGIRQLYCNIDSLWYIETKDYDSSTGQYYWNPQHKSGTFNFQIENCTEVVESCIRTIQKFFRHRRWLRSYPMRVRDMMHIKTFRISASSYLPRDVIDCIEKRFLRLDSLPQRKKYRPMVTIETKLFKHFALSDGNQDASEASLCSA